MTVIGGGGGSSGGAGGTGGRGGASAQITATFNVLPLQTVTGVSAQGGQFNNSSVAGTIAAGGTGFAKGGNGGILAAVAVPPRIATRPLEMPVIPNV